jgi:hypothetical protein
MSPYLLGARIIGARAIGTSKADVRDIPAWERWAIGVGAAASVATLIEITYQWLKRSR